MFPHSNIIKIMFNVQLFFTIRKLITMLVAETTVFNNIASLLGCSYRGIYIGYECIITKILICGYRGQEFT